MDGGTVRGTEGLARLRSLLAQQLTAPVRFTQTVRMAMDHGVDRFVEFRHRRVLVGLVRRIRPGVEAVNLGDPSDLPALLALADATWSGFQVPLRRQCHLHPPGSSNSTWKSST